MSAFPPIARLLPHGPPMILVDEVVADGGGVTVCRVVVREGAAFVEDGRVPAVVAIEYMAQTVGAFAGLRAREAGLPVRVGYLLGTRELVLETDSFAVGDELRIEAREVWNDLPLGAFACTVTRAGVRVAAATLNVYQSQGEDPPA